MDSIGILESLLHFLVSLNLQSNYEDSLIGVHWRHYRCTAATQANVQKKNTSITVLSVTQSRRYVKPARPDSTTHLEILKGVIGSYVGHYW